MRASSSRPNLYLVDADAFFHARFLSGGLEMFFKNSSIAPSASLCAWAWTGREFAIAHLAQFAAQSLHGDGEAELLKHPLSQIDQPPAHDTWIAGVGPSSIIFSSAARCASLSFDGWPGALRSMRPSGPWALNFNHPVAHDLQRHIADLCRLGAHRAFNKSRRAREVVARRVLLVFLATRANVR